MQPSYDVNNFLNDPFFSSKFLNPEYLFSKMYVFFHSVVPFFFQGETLGVIKFALSILSLFFIIIICYCVVRMLELRAKEHAHLHHEMIEYAHHQAEKKKKKEEGEGTSKNTRWNQVLTYVFSSNPGDWKLAIMEADSMLDGLLDQLGYKGETMGDKLKAADRETFKSLTEAWEVHTVRNRIAHEGSAFDISQQEAKRIIAVYEQIFRQYGFI